MKMLIQTWIALSVSLMCVPLGFHIAITLGLLETTMPMGLYRYRMFLTMAMGFIMLVVPIVSLGILMYFWGDNKE